MSIFYPVELLREIILFLPRLEVEKCQLISQSFNSLISDQSSLPILPLHHFYKLDNTGIFFEIHKQDWPLFMVQTQEDSMPIALNTPQHINSLKYCYFEKYFLRKFDKDAHKTMEFLRFFKIRAKIFEVKEFKASHPEVDWFSSAMRLVTVEKALLNLEIDDSHMQIDGSTFLFSTLRSFRFPNHELTVEINFTTNTQHYFSEEFIDSLLFFMDRGIHHGNRFVWHFTVISTVLDSTQLMEEVYRIFFNTEDAKRLLGYLSFHFDPKVQISCKMLHEKGYICNKTIIGDSRMDTYVIKRPDDKNLTVIIEKDAGARKVLYNVKSLSFVL